METKSVGLILGKFAPLHRGHQYLIDTAIRRVSKLYILVYEATETTNIDLETRCNWIRKLYPTAHVIKGTLAPECTGHTEDVMKIQDRYVRSMMVEKITHVFSSEWYGEHISKALGAENVVVDLHRVAIPLSATFVRDNMLESNKFLNPIVNRDVVRKVVFLGAESTGKSTLTEEMSRLYGTKMVEEMGRWYWDNNHDINGELTANQLVELAELHRKSEEEAYTKSGGLTFIDTNAITTWTYGQHYGRPSKELDDYAKQCRSRYHLTILCSTDIPFVQDGTRLPEQLRQKFQDQLMWKLHELGIVYHTVTGSVQERTEQVKKLIGNAFGITLRP